MNDEEAKGILKAEVIKLRPGGYDGLVARLAGKQEILEVVGLSGSTYHIEFEGFWGDEERENLRIVGSVDDGGGRAFLPLTDSFTIDPAGAIIDHSAA